MIVYRLEYDGTGIYCSPFPVTAKAEHWFYEMVDEHCEDKKNHPTAEQDFKQLSLNYRFACPDAQSLYSWFNPYWSKLSRLKKARVLAYEIDDFIWGKSGKQLAFIMKDAKLVNTCTVKEFLENYERVLK